MADRMPVQLRPPWVTRARQTRWQRFVAALKNWLSRVGST